MTQIQDAEFGDIDIRTSPAARQVSIKLAPNGNLRVSTPGRTPKFMIKSIINRSRSQIREMIQNQQTIYQVDQQIGKSHHLVIQPDQDQSSVSTIGTKILVNLSADQDITAQSIQSEIRSHILKALRKEAKSYLPRRLSYLANQHDFSYQSTKLTHASSRWGSCSSSGTISMNISLMQLPFELIDYVLIHELCHTRQMNHSPEFWELVESYDPDYKQHRRAIKQHTPSI